MSADAKNEQIVDEVNNYCIYILEINESRWTGTGKVRLEGVIVVFWGTDEARVWCWDQEYTSRITSSEITNYYC